MRAYLLSAVLALTYFAALTVTAPLDTDNLSPLNARTHDSQNTPNQLAETLQPRALSPIWWPDPSNPRTGLFITFLSRHPGPSILKLITTSYIAIQNHLAEHGDGLVPQGVFEATYKDLNLWTRNANNHQQTFGVLKSAINALNHYMFTENLGSATFLVFDGGIEVAVGAIGPHAMMADDGG